MSRLSIDAHSMWSVDGALASPSPTSSMNDKQTKLEKHLTSCKARFKEIFTTVTEHTDFAVKYDVQSKDPLIYLNTKQPNEFTFDTEVFPVVTDPPQRLVDKLVDELTYHSMFEEIIHRYTKERRKPNPALQETRSSDFCYQLCVRFEAIPDQKAKYPESYRLIREFQVLQHIWESYRTELEARKCSTDQLVGFPMPFEFRNVVGSSKYDFPKMTIEEFPFYNLSGKAEKICLGPISSFGVGTDAKTIMSSLSYMSTEKVGPSVPYLMDLMQSQGRVFSLSSALKVYDQLISRLMIMHKYGLVHCDINPRCLNFGCREATNVLYISSFNKAVLGSPQSVPLHLFHDRFVSHTQVKERKCHYVCDLESAFYVFVYLILGKLPWDSRLTANQEESTDQRVPDPVTHKSRTVDMKEKFWTSSEAFNWVTKSVSYEFTDVLYSSFSIDVLETLYTRVRDSMSRCISMPTSNFHREIFISGSAPYNCYFGVRKVIASYFRFESLNQPLKDVLCNSKLEMLAKEERADKRAAWDMSAWCWNFMDADPDKKRR